MNINPEFEINMHHINYLLPFRCFALRVLQDNIFLQSSYFLHPTFLNVEIF